MLCPVLGVDIFSSGVDTFSSGVDTFCYVVDTSWDPKKFCFLFSTTAVDPGVILWHKGHLEKQYMDNHASIPGTNERPSSSKESKVISSQITPFGQRMNKFISQFVYNAQNTDNGLRQNEVENMEDDVIRRVQPSERCSLQVLRSQPESGCRFMYDRTEDWFNSLENWITKHTNTCAACGLYGEPTDATLASQVIGIEGHNPSGHCLIASKVVDSLPNSLDADLPAAKKLALDKENQPSSPSDKSKVLSLVSMPRAGWSTVRTFI